MKRVTYILIIILISISGYSQSVLRPDLVFSIDTPFVFKHYRDLVITSKFKNIKNENVFDTVYYSVIDKNGQTLVEFINKDFQIVNKYKYDSLNRIEQIKSFHKSQLQGQNGLNEISIQIIHYNDFDSVSQIEHFTCNRIIKSDMIKAQQRKIDNSTSLDELWNIHQSYSDYTNDWEWNYVGVLKNIYNSSHNKILSKFYYQNSCDSKWSYEYDSFNRKISEYWCNYKINMDLNRDTNSCQLKQNKYYFYGIGSQTSIDTTYQGISMTIKKVKTSNNQKGYVDDILETWGRFNVTQNMLKDGEGKSEIKFFYNDQNKIIKRTEYCVGCSDTIRFIYNYKK